MGTDTERDVKRVQALLREQAGELASKMLTEVAEALGGLASITPEDAVQFHAWGVRVIEGVLDREAHGAFQPSFLAELGERARARAREGRDIGKLITAYAIAGRRVIDELALVAEQDPSLRSAAGDLMVRILGAVEGLQRRFVEEYEAERAEVEKSSGIDERAFVRDLVHGNLMLNTITDRSRALQVPKPPYRLLRFWTGREREDGTIHSWTGLRSEALGESWSLGLVQATELTLICRAKDVKLDHLRRLEPASVGAAPTTIAVSDSFDHLARAPEMYRDAGAALMYALARRRLGVITTSQALPARWLAEHPDVRSRLIGETLGEVATKDELLTTLAAYVEEGPSLQAVGNRVFAHTNTIGYRLNKIRDLTGRDPRHPVDLAELCLGLLALEIESLLSLEPDLFPS